MNLAEWLETIPGYAKDLKLNLSSLLQQAELTKPQIWGTVVASAVASRNPQLLQMILTEAAEQIEPQVIEAAKGAAAVMAMNNVYYRFLHLTKHEKYTTMPARLRMSILRSHGVDPTDFELWCEAVSAINGCGTCVESHDKIVRGKGISEEAVLGAVRIASVIHGLATVFDAEQVTSATPVMA
jgi:alkyl hydroperoxide reductase subunit D